MSRRATIGASAYAFAHAGPAWEDVIPETYPQMQAPFDEVRTPAPRWGFLLLRVSVFALVGVGAAIGTDLYLRTHPDRPLVSLASLTGTFTIPESVAISTADMETVALGPAGAATSDPATVTLPIEMVSEAVAAPGPAGDIAGTGGAALGDLAVAGFGPGPGEAPSAAGVAPAADPMPQAVRAEPAPPPAAAITMVAAVDPRSAGLEVVGSAETTAAPPSVTAPSGALPAESASEGDAPASGGMTPVAAPDPVQLAALPTPALPTPILTTPVTSAPKTAAQSAGALMVRAVDEAAREMRRPVLPSLPVEASAAAQPVGPLDPTVSARHRLTLADAVNAAAAAAVAAVEPLPVAGNAPPAIPALAMLDLVPGLGIDAAATLPTAPPSTIGGIFEYEAALARASAGMPDDAALPLAAPPAVSAEAILAPAIQPVPPALPVEALAAAQPAGPLDPAVSALHRLALADAVDAAAAAAVAAVEPVAVAGVAPSAIPAFALRDILPGIGVDAGPTLPAAPPSTVGGIFEYEAALARASAATDDAAVPLAALTAGAPAVSEEAPLSPLLDAPGIDAPSAEADAPEAPAAIYDVAAIIEDAARLGEARERSGEAAELLQPPPVPGAGAAPAPSDALRTASLGLAMPEPALRDDAAEMADLVVDAVATMLPVPEPAVLRAEAAGQDGDQPIIVAVETTRLADVVTQATTVSGAVGRVTEAATAAAVTTSADDYAVMTAVSLLRPAVDPAEVTDLDLRGRGLTPCEAGDDACRAFVAAEDGAFDLPSPVLARYGRNPIVLGGVELPLDKAEAERALRCLAFIAYAEAGNQGPRGMAAVIWVVMNRVASGSFPNDPCAVVAQEGQFEPMTLGRYEEVARRIRSGEMPPFLNARGAERILQRTARLVLWQMLDGYFADDPTFGAQYFIAPGAMQALGRPMPAWTERFAMTAAIGDHSFYRRDNL